MRRPAAACSGRDPFRLMPNAISMAGMAAPPIRWMGCMTSSGTCQPVPATTRPSAEPTIIGFLRIMSAKPAGVVRCELVVASRAIRKSGVKKASWKISSGAT